MATPLRRLTLGLALALCACGSAATSQIAALASEARANPLRAHAAHRDGRLRVQALVLSTGLKGVETIRGSGTSSAVAFGSSNLAVGVGSSEFTARKVSTGYPYLIARDPGRSESDGELLCFFQPDDIDTVAALSPGAQVTVEGDFQEFSQGGSRVVLNLCEIR